MFLTPILLKTDISGSTVRKASVNIKYISSNVTAAHHRQKQQNRTCFLRCDNLAVIFKKPACRPLYRVWPAWNHEGFIFAVIILYPWKWWFSEFKRHFRTTFPGKWPVYSFIMIHVCGFWPTFHFPLSFGTIMTWTVFVPHEMNVFHLCRYHF